MTKEKFSSFVKKPIADTIAHVSSLYALSLDSTDEVNKIVENGLKNGGIEPTAARDYGFMQQRTIEDFDGHTWEFFYMDVSQFPAAQ